MSGTAMAKLCKDILLAGGPAGHRVGVRGQASRGVERGADFWVRW
jgi:hypothetical protein